MEFREKDFVHIRTTQDSQKQIGILIKQIRNYRNLTQKELGKLCNIAESQIGQYEIGVRKPKLETLSKITTALRISIDQFLALANYDLSQTDVDNILEQLEMWEQIKAEKLVDYSKQHLTEEEKKKIKQSLDLIEYYIENPFSKLGILDKEKEEIEVFPYEIIDGYFELNQKGRDEVVKRIKELLLLPEYRRIE